MTAVIQAGLVLVMTAIALALVVVGSIGWISQ